jgi:hypothetical protein
MRNLVLGLLATVMFCGCSNGYQEKNYPTKPPELSDCKVYYLHNDSGDNITVMRCPNSTTSSNYTTKAGKTIVHHTEIVVDGVQYAKKDLE